MEWKLVSLEMLRKLFGDNTPDHPVIIHQTCCECGCDVDIELHKTSGGFGLQGGVLLEKNGHLAADCLKCYEKISAASV